LQSFIDVSGERIGPIFNGQEVFLDFLNLEDGTDTLSRNVGKGLQFYALYIPEERKSDQHGGGTLKLRVINGFLMKVDKYVIFFSATFHAYPFRTVTQLHLNMCLKQEYSSLIYAINHRINTQRLFVIKAAENQNKRLNFSVTDNIIELGYNFMKGTEYFVSL
jgi:hypothetical protein